MCLRGVPGAVVVTGGIAVHAEPLVGQVRRAMTRVAARHQAAGDTAEAQRWKQMGRTVGQRPPAHVRPQPRQATGHTRSAAMVFKQADGR